MSPTSHPTSQPSSWWVFVEQAAEGAPMTAVAARAGFDKSALSRWKRGERPDPHMVVRFARAYEIPVVQALAAAGVITEAEADLREVAVRPEELTDEQIAHEVARRLGIA